MENKHISREDLKFWTVLGVATIGAMAWIGACVPMPREPNEQQSQDPQFIECVDYRMVHDDFNPAPGPQGMYVGPTKEELAVRHCMDDVFPLPQ